MLRHDHAQCLCTRYREPKRRAGRSCREQYGTNGRDVRHRRGQQQAAVGSRYGHFSLRLWSGSGSFILGNLNWKIRNRDGLRPTLRTTKRAKFASFVALREFEGKLLNYIFSAPIVVRVWVPNVSPLPIWALQKDCDLPKHRSLCDRRFCVLGKRTFTFIQKIDIGRTSALAPMMAHRRSLNDITNGFLITCPASST